MDRIRQPGSRIVGQRDQSAPVSESPGCDHPDLGKVGAQRATRPGTMSD